jgi:hypothetical protein
LKENLTFLSKLLNTDKMKNICFVVIMAILSFQNTDAQLLKNAKKFINSNAGGLTEKDAADGIKEALVNGTGNSVKVVSALNGYWGNPEIKIPFPPEDGIETSYNRYG